MDNYVYNSYLFILKFLDIFFKILKNEIKVRGGYGKYKRRYKKKHKK